jgi:hypothetical protein
VENNEEIRIATTSKHLRKLSMYGAEGEREPEDQGAVLLNDPLKTPQPKIKADERVHFEGSQHHRRLRRDHHHADRRVRAVISSIFLFRPPQQGSSRMFSTEQPRPAESSLAPKPFGGTTTDTDNAERWLLYLKKYIDYRHLRGDEALALFKLLLIDQAQNWLYALPEGQADSFERLEEAFMQRFRRIRCNVTKKPPTCGRESGSYGVRRRIHHSTETAANQIQFRDEQQLGYCIIRGLRAPLRMHFLQNQHGSLE